MTAITESNHPRLRTIFECESQVFRGVCNKDIISTLGIFPFDVFRFVNVQGRMSRIGAQELYRFINGFSFTEFQPGKVFKKDDFEVEIEERNIRRHKSLFLSLFERSRRGGGSNSSSGVHVDSTLVFHPIRRKFFFREV